MNLRSSRRLAILLIGGISLGCQGNEPAEHVSAISSTQSPWPMQSAPAEGEPADAQSQDALARLRTAEKRITSFNNVGYVPLVQDPLDPASHLAKFATALSNRDPQALGTMADAAANVAIRQALQQFQFVEGRQLPNDARELAPYAFTWARSAEARREVHLRIESNALQVQTTRGTLPVADRWVAITGSPERILPEATRSERRPLDDATGAELMQLYAQKVAAERLPEKRWKMLHGNLELTAIGEDARRVAAYHQIGDLLTRATHRLQRFPTDLNEALLVEGTELINLVPADPATADLVIGFDGIQAHRLTLRFPSGLELDSVWYWLLLGPKETICEPRSYAEYQRELGRPFQTWAAFDLVPAAEAKLPLIEEQALAQPAPDSTGTRPVKAR